MTNPIERCPACGCEGDVDVTGKRYCTNARCGLPEANWSEFQSMRDDRDRQHDFYLDAAMTRDELAEENAELKSELAAVKADAKRYQWLRQHSFVENGTIEFGPGFEQQFPIFLDDAIERQMKYTEGNQR